MSAMEELRKGLLEAAERDVAAQRVRRRRSRRTIGVVVALLLGGTAAATAADLIAIGDPSPELRTVDGFEKYEPTAARQVVLQADDPDGDLDCGVALYPSTRRRERARSPVSCAGANSASSQGDVFRPYPADAVGACIGAGALHVRPARRSGRGRPGLRRGGAAACARSPPRASPSRPDRAVRSCSSSVVNDPEAGSTSRSTDGC